jgi:antitoxin component of MazEF toxin-antitoxin module
MVKHLQKIGNSRGIVLDRGILDLLNINDDTSLEITTVENGLLIRPLTAKEAYKNIAVKHRKSLDKLAK